MSTHRKTGSISTSDATGTTSVCGREGSGFSHEIATPRTDAREVFYCDDCGSPVVNHWESITAHRYRIHGGMAVTREYAQAVRA